MTGRLGGEIRRDGRTAAALAVLAVAVAALLLPLPAWAQCAMCNTAATGNSVGRGLSISVLFMLSSLGLIVLGFVRLVVRQGPPADEPPSVSEDAAGRPA